MVASATATTTIEATGNHYSDFWQMINCNEDSREFEGFCNLPGVPIGKLFIGSLPRPYAFDSNNSLTGMQIKTALEA